MNRIIVIVTAIEITYLAFSFTLAKTFGHWSWVGEILRSDLRVLSIVCYGYFYQKYFYHKDDATNFKARELLSPQFVVAVMLFLLFAVLQTNAENEPIIWQFVFALAGVTAGLREELFYRGMVQNVLQRKYGHKTALIVSTLIFTFSHVQYLYLGQFRAILMVALAGVIFSCIFIHTGNVIFTALVHGLYDAILSVNVAPFRLSNGAAVPVLILIALVFLLIVSDRLFVSNRMDSADDNNDQDSFSLP